MPKTDKSAVQSIDQLTSRFRKLDTEKTRIQTLLDTTSQRLEELLAEACLLYTSPSPRDLSTSRMPSSA